MSADIEGLIGHRFKWLTVKSRAENTAHGKSRWVCECACGNMATIEGAALRRGKTTSCGCRKRYLDARRRMTATARTPTHDAMPTADDFS